MKNRYRMLAALFACGICATAMANVTASLDKDQVALGDTVQLSLQSDSDTDGQPDISPLQQDFDVLGTSHGSTVQIVNGSKSTQTQVALVLAPKHVGTIHIPPLQWNGQHSQALDLTVGPGSGTRAPNPSSAAGAGNSPVFLTATIDQKQPYVQAAVLLTVKLYAATQIEQASLDLSGNGDVLIKQLGSDRQSSEVRDGRNYQVVQRQYVLLPQRSGRISLNGPVLDAKIQDAGNNSLDIDSFFSNPFGALMSTSRPLHLRGAPIELNVLARPTASSGNWLPAQKVTLEESWQPAQGAIHAGEPITRHLRLTAVGLSGAQLPDLAASMQLPDGVKMYPDQTNIKDTLQDGKIVGSREQDIALIAANPGRTVLPAIKLAWWDTAHKLQREADLPSRVLDILPAIAPAGQPAPPPKSAAAPGPIPTPANVSASSPLPAPIDRAGGYPRLSAWQWLCIIFVLLWIGTLLAWWFSRRRNADVVAKTKTQTTTNAEAEARTTADTMPSTKEVVTARTRRPIGRASKPLNALVHACHANDAQSARRAILDWAAGVWPEAPPRGLNALAEYLTDAKIGDLLRQLDRACYAGAAWQGAPLAQAFEAPIKPVVPKKANPAIPALYAND